MIGAQEIAELPSGYPWEHEINDSQIGVRATSLKLSDGRLP